MSGLSFTIERVRKRDLFTLTRMAYANMAAVDREIDRIAAHPLLRLLGYAFFPLYLATSGQGYKATRDGHILGCAFLHLRPRSGLIFNVSVNTAARHQGVATALMRHIEQQVRAAGRAWLGLRVGRDNAPAQNLYRGLGYRPFHPGYLRRERGGVLPPPSRHVAVARLGEAEGRERYHHYAFWERREGDTWAAAIVNEEFAQPPVGGSYWRCLHGAEEIGCAWVGGPRAWPAIYLLLSPPHWGQQELVLSFVQRLLPQPVNAYEGLDLYLGSSGHHEALAPRLRPYGFSPQRRQEILMLMRIDGADLPPAGAEGAVDL